MTEKKAEHHTRVDESTYRRLVELARHNHRSINAEIEVALEEHVRRQEAAR